MRDLDFKLNEIGLVPLHESFKSCSDEDIKSIGEEFKETLPSDYVWFISNYGEAFVSADVGFRSIETNPWASASGLNGVTYFYSGQSGSDQSVLNLKERYRDQIKDCLLPIAESPGGNQVCLSLCSEDTGSVYFWDHNGKIGSDLYLIAKSFRSFLDSFEKESEQSDEKKPKIVSSRISDDF